MNESIWKGKHGPLLIAEIGGNHEGDFEYAKKLTELAIEADVDFIKFQLYTGDGLVNPLESLQRNQHFKNFELSKENHLELAELCKKNFIGYAASVWHEDFFSWIDDYLDFYKIGSGDLTAYPILKKIARIGKPILLSTGLATESDIMESVKFIQKINSDYVKKDMLALLQCTSMYPINFSDAHLNVMQRLREITKLSYIGYSDHTIGIDALKYAYAMKANILEFHFTDNRLNRSFRDHTVSLTKKDVKQLINEIQTINKLKGNYKKIQLDIELENNHVNTFRRALYLKHDLPKGSTIKECDLIALRPNHGICSSQYENLIGKITNKNIKAYEILKWEYIKTYKNEVG